MRPFAKPLAALCAVLALANCAATPTAAVPEASRAVVEAGAVRLASQVDATCLAEAIYFEARPTAASQAAVAHVILNRARDPRFPRSVCGVVREGCQFSYRCSGRSLALSDPTKRATAQRMAETVLTGVSDPTRGALFFHSAAAAPGWFTSRPRIGEIGGNIFYR